ncbi:hypothetical protein [Streptomyces mutomycini]|uniref:LigA protein n=1 Tax=Streptomyces mutomycini TaxID=284036 RepID=A0ABW0B403_9ACTN|nr:hypothetical protein [Streptomyces mutomycini]
MTQTPLAPRTTGTPPAVRNGRARVLLRVLAIVSCLPYLSLKVAWTAGSQVGIPDGSPLLDHRTTMAVVNGGTVLMDGAVIVLALLLTQAWGRRVRAWTLALPMWVASGLLLPIMAGLPVQLLVAAVTGRSPASADSRSFLDDWVFALVYPGFVVQGLALGALFALYARDRWGHLWQGALRDLPASPTGPALRAAAVAASLLAVVPATMHLLWAAGSAAGLNGTGTTERTDDFHALQALDALFVAAAVAGVLLLAFRRSGGLSLKVPLVLAWGGSGAVACSGGWMSVASLAGVAEAADRPTTAMGLTYAVQMLVGMLVVTLGAYFFAERAAAAGTAGPRA